MAGQQMICTTGPSSIRILPNSDRRMNSCSGLFCRWAKKIFRMKRRTKDLYSSSQTFFSKSGKYDAALIGDNLSTNKAFTSLSGHFYICSSSRGYNLDMQDII